MIVSTNNTGGKREKINTFYIEIPRQNVDHDIHSIDSFSRGYHANKAKNG